MTSCPASRAKRPERRSQVFKPREQAACPQLHWFSTGLTRRWRSACIPRALPPSKPSRPQTEWTARTLTLPVLHHQSHHRRHIASSSLYRPAWRSTHTRAVGTQAGRENVDLRGEAAPSAAASAAMMCNARVTLTGANSAIDNCGAQLALPANQSEPACPLTKKLVSRRKPSLRIWAGKFKTGFRNSSATLPPPPPTSGRRWPIRRNRPSRPASAPWMPPSPAPAKRPSPS